LLITAAAPAQVINPMTCPWGRSDAQHLKAFRRAAPRAETPGLITAKVCHRVSRQ